MSNLVEIKKNITSPAMLAQFKLALPAHITPERFQRVAMTALLNNPDISECSTQSVMTSLLKCAQDGLVPDNREAAIVKFKGQAQYMPMVYGLIKRMRNSGEVTNVNAYCVYENDVFDYEIENGVERIRHKPSITGNRGQFLLAYAVVGLAEGNPHIEVMVKDEIEKARKASPNQKGSDTPSGIWAAWYDEMAKKTVLHRASKRVPTSAEAVEFMQKDMRMTLNGGFEDDEAAPKQSLVDSINAAVDLNPVTASTQQPVEDAVVVETNPEVEGRPGPLEQAFLNNGGADAPAA